ncbi:hypothetical protein SLEP1_g47048 [Rubroshorea leprosula]|uniref:MADS-box domain-containing protein n=1 Tax=Rubroshorea leprosula TaxID=152421 RepID=A0AAV5LR15_9ROSI|nr:hypothetical protein SLEP1_g47048 [Rubroshorea leprosula]
MGRGKLSMELIKNEKTRVLTFRKRLKGLMKKAHEFTTLCGVKTCMIIYGPPKLKGTPATVDIWPSDSAQVKAVIHQYKEAVALSDSRGKKPFNLVDFFAVRRRMINDEISKLRKVSLEAKYPIKDDLIKNLSMNQVRLLSSKFDLKIEAAKRKLKTMKRDRYLMEIEDPKSGIIPNFSNFQGNLDFEVAKPEFNTQLTPYQPYDESLQIQPFGYDVNSVEHPMMTLLMNGELAPGMSSSSGSNNNFTQNGLIPFSTPSHYQDPPSAAAMLDSNAALNNSWAVPLRFIGPPMQPTPVQYQVMASLPSQSHIPHFGDYFRDMNDFATKDKQLRF